ncbi:ATP-grasp domain-containing protein [Alteromonas sp. a30]|uniref:ATP-grasp domain-containing protein n=1 Tax=Alteromonas sp. a30 TaxID=2730917 RepID=UPI00227DED2B|nr:hypothetical protein [Alteromonas sp. a30]MCY7295286.1 hypothetical protein [Alteromonas sp. a30]
MEKQISALTQACEQLKLDYRFIDKEQNVVQVAMPWGYEYFQIGRTPFNKEVVWGLLRDKKHSYDLFHDCVTMPQTLAFLDPSVPEEYRNYSQFDSIDAITRNIESTLDFPVVIKPNAGALGMGVYLCQHASEVEQALTHIFNKQSQHYDYVALAQTFVPTQREYRLVCAFGEPVLLYQRGNIIGFNAQYWHKGEKAVHIENATLMQRLTEFVRPIYQKLEIGFVGFDIIESDDNTLYLIELNSSPKFNNFIAANGSEAVIQMYVKTLNLFTQKTPRF